MITDDRQWCTDCNEPKYSFKVDEEANTCNDCGTTVRDKWPRKARIRDMVGSIVVLVIGVVVFVGPPAYALYAFLFHDGPLYATRTVETTTTEAYGILPSIALPLVIWVVVLFVAWAAASGAVPRRI